MRSDDWHVLRELLALRAKFNELFERAALPPAGVSLTSTTGFEPAVDLWENDDSLVVEIDLPGARGDRLELRLEGNVLNVGGEFSSTPDGRAAFLRLERPRGRFARRIPLPVQVVGTPRATLRAGVLSVLLEKAPESQRRLIPVEGAEVDR